MSLPKAIFGLKTNKQVNATQEEKVIFALYRNYIEIYKLTYKWYVIIAWSSWVILMQIQCAEKNHPILWHQNHVKNWLFKYFVVYAELIKTFGLQIGPVQNSYNEDRKKIKTHN